MLARHGGNYYTKFCPHRASARQMFQEKVIEWSAPLIAVNCRRLSAICAICAQRTNAPSPSLGLIGSVRCLLSVSADRTPALKTMTVGSVRHYRDVSKLV